MIKLLATPTRLEVVVGSLSKSRVSAPISTWSGVRRNWIRQSWEHSRLIVTKTVIVECEDLDWCSTPRTGSSLMFLLWRSFTPRYLHADSLNVSPARVSWLSLIAFDFSVIMCHWAHRAAQIEFLQSHFEHRKATTSEKTDFARLGVLSISVMIGKLSSHEYSVSYHNARLLDFVTDFFLWYQTIIRLRWTVGNKCAKLFHVIKAYRVHCVGAFKVVD